MNEEIVYNSQNFNSGAAAKSQLTVEARKLVDLFANIFVNHVLRKMRSIKEDPVRNGEEKT